MKLLFVILFLCYCTCSDAECQFCVTQHGHFMCNSMILRNELWLTCCHGDWLPCPTNIDGSCDTIRNYCENWDKIINMTRKFSAN